MVGALAARQRIIQKAKDMKAKRRSALALTDLNKLLLEGEGGASTDEQGMQNNLPNSPPTSPLMGYGRRKKDGSIAAKKSAIRLKRIENRGKGKGGFVLAPQIEHVFTELKNGPSQRKRKRIKTSEDGKTNFANVPASPRDGLFDIELHCRSLGRSPRERALIELYEIHWAKKGKMTHWESLAAVRHQAKSATIGNLPCYCTPMRFRVRAKSTFGWGPWSPISDYMQTSPNRPARPSRVSSGKITATTIEIKWPVPECNGAKILYYTLYACKKGGAFKAAYRGEQNKFTLGTAPKSRSPRKKTFANKFKDKNDDDDEESDEEGEDFKVEKVEVEAGGLYLVKLIATNKIGDSVSSEVCTFEASAKVSAKNDAQTQQKIFSEASNTRVQQRGVQQEAAESIMASWLHHSREVRATNTRSNRQIMKEHGNQNGKLICPLVPLELHS